MGLYIDICPKCGGCLEIQYNDLVCSECGFTEEIDPFYVPGAKEAKPKPARKRPKSPSDHQRAVYKALFAGGNMGAYGNRYRVWDRWRRPLFRMSSTTYLIVKKLCRVKDGFQVIDRKKVLKLRPNTWVKRYYLSLKKS